MSEENDNLDAELEEALEGEGAGADEGAPAPEPPPPYASAKLIFSRAGGYNFPDPTDAGVSVRRDEFAPPSKVGEGFRRAGRSTAQT